MRETSETTPATAPESAAAVPEPPAYLTHAILGALALIFLGEVLFSLDSLSLPLLGISPNSLIAFGGIYPSAIRNSGEWHRLLVGPMLHGDLLHLAFNGISLYFLGSALENMIGRAWFGTIYFFGGIGGAWLSFVTGAETVVSVGASGAIMAVIAAVAALAFRLPAGAERTTTLTSCAQFLIPALIPRNSPSGMTIDVAAHFGGALTGAAIAGLVFAVWRRDRQWPSFGKLALVAAIAGLLISEKAAFTAIRLFPEYRDRAAFSFEASPENLARSRLAFEAAAERGDASAMNHMGVIYARGLGVDQDLVKASAWYGRAAANGNAIAMGNLAALYANGWGVTKDTDKSLEWYRRSAAAGYAKAMLQLGLAYSAGTGVEKNLTKAREWFEKAAAKNEAASIRNLGIIYRDGLGVDVDFAKSRTWFERAAALGDASAMTRLGIFYHKGQGVAVDYVKARSWYELAAAKGDGDAMTNIAILHANGFGVEKNEATGAEWYEKGLQTGNSRAAYALAVFADEGKGIAQDPARAAVLILQAAKADDQDAKKALTGEMTGWAPATIQRVKAELQRLGFYRGQLNETWDNTCRQAIAAYLAAP